jgi:hypothetical protein
VRRARATAAARLGRRARPRTAPVLARAHPCTERLAEEQRLADIAEAERLEKERLRLAHEAKLAAELAARVALELEKRREVEDAENAPLREELQCKLRDEERTRANGAEWAHYIGCHLLPGAQSEAAVNMFIAEWAEAPAAQLEQAMEDCDRAATLLQQIADAHLIALRKPAVDAAALWHPAALSALGALSTLKLDYVTAETLANSEERATSRNELQLAAQTASLKYALWVNLARNPRVKSVEFGEVGLTIVELPKALPVASVAVGLRQLRTEHAAPSFGKPSLFQTLGGVTIVDLLTLPPPPKRVKGWTLRHASTAQPAVTRMAYPIPPVGGESAAAAAAAAAAAPPLRLMLTLPSDVVVADKMVRVGWWDEDSGQWSLDGVSEIRYDSEVRSLSFLTVHLCSLAVLQHTYAELPYKRWCLTPTGPSSSVRARAAAACRELCELVESRRRRSSRAAFAQAHARTSRPSWPRRVRPRVPRRVRPGRCSRCRRYGTSLCLTSRPKAACSSSPCWPS